ncbi:MAG: ComEC/Rec2 family competence protein, partial [Blastocatellia bacterium]
MPRRLAYARLALSQQPLVFLASGYIFGLLLAAGTNVSAPVWLCGATLMCLIAGVCWLRQVRVAVVTALLLCGAFLAGGMSWTASVTAGTRADLAPDIGDLLERGPLSLTEPVELWGTIDAAPELAPDRIYLSLRVDRAAAFRRELPARGHAQLVIPFSDAESRAEYDALSLDYGTRVRVLARLHNPRGYRNPGAPDFGAIMRRRGFGVTATVKSPLLIETLGPGDTGTRLAPLYRVLYRWRGQAITALLRNLRQPAAGMLIAALFGNRHFLDQRAATAFREDGTFHLLVISGMHIAMIAAAVLWLTQWMRQWRLWRYGLVAALMWSYALLAGAEPAVTRAVVMLSVILVGHLFYRAAPGVNTLAAAALILLAWRPGDLFDAGFQLSMLTVLVIVTVSAPLLTRLAHIGKWRPVTPTPWPPRVPAALRAFAELLFWHEQAFRRDMREELIQYKLHKHPLAVWISQAAWRRAAQWALGSIIATFLTTVSVQLTLAPLLITYFHRLSLLSPLANIIEGALFFVLLLATLPWLFLHAISAAAGAWLANAISWLGELAVTLSQPLSGVLPAWLGASVCVPDFSASATRWLFTLYFALALILAIAISRWHPLTRKQPRTGRLPLSLVAGVSLTGVIALFVILVWHPAGHQYTPGRLSVTFLDVGQGDAAVVSFPDGRLLLIDSGGRMAMRDQQDESLDEYFIEDRIGVSQAAVAPYLWNRGIRRLDWIAASHSDADHTQGFPDIIRDFRPAAAFVGMLPTADAQFEPLRQALVRHNVRMQVLTRGQTLEVAGARLEVLSPFAEHTRSPRYGNNQCLTLKLTLGQRGFLFTGDIENETEAALLAANAEVRADVLKVAHHGSRTSSTESFLARVRPAYAVISAAAPSPFGHPHPEVVARLAATGARTLETSRCGAITISTDGNDLLLDSFVRCE